MTELLENPVVQYYLTALVAAIPVARTFKRAGLNPFFTLLLAAPMTGLILCMGVLAFRNWKEPAA